MALRNRISPEDFGQLLLTAIGFLLLVWLIVVSAGCKTQKQEYHYTGEDFAQVVDSTSATGKTETQTQTGARDSVGVVGTITFADGGGVVTAGGVQMSGVQTIDGSLLAGSQMFHVEHYIHDTTFVAVRDTITQTRTEVVKVEKTTRPLWWLYVVCFVLGAGVVVALKKIPYTRPLMMWL